MFMLNKKMKGFSLIELMVAIAITAIILSISVNIYTKYVAKQAVAKAIQATGYLRQAVEDYYSLYGYLPGNLDLISGPGAPYISGYSGSSPSQPEYYNPDTDISRIAYYNTAGANCNASTSACTSTGDTLWRQVEVTFSNPTSVAAKYLSNLTFIMRINLNGGVINWECATYNWAGGPIDGTLLPVYCYNSALNI